MFYQILNFNWETEYKRSILMYIKYDPVCKLMNDSKMYKGKTLVSIFIEIIQTQKIFWLDASIINQL